MNKTVEGSMHEIQMRFAPGAQSILGRKVELIDKPAPGLEKHGSHHLVIEGRAYPFHVHGHHGIHCGSMMFADFRTPWELAEALVRNLGSLPEYRKAQAAQHSSEQRGHSGHE